MMRKSALGVLGVSIGLSFGCADVATTGEEGVLTTSELSVENCPNGGKKISLGEDLDEDGTLDEEEVTEVAYVCTGVSGEDGSDGADGLDGSDGADGLDGSDGADGLDGSDGADGLDGSDGADGMDGSDGADGMAGVSASDRPSYVSYTYESAIAVVSVDLSVTPQKLVYSDQCAGDCEDESDDVEYDVLINDALVSTVESRAWESPKSICLGDAAEGSESDVAFAHSNNDPDEFFYIYDPRVRDADVSECPLPSRVRGHNEGFESGETGYGLVSSSNTVSIEADPDDVSNTVLRFVGVSASCAGSEMVTKVSVPTSASSLALRFQAKGTRGGGGPSDYGHLSVYFPNEDDGPGWSNAYSSSGNISAAWSTQVVCLPPSYQGRVLPVNFSASSVSLSGGSCASGVDHDYSVDDLEIVADPSCD